MHVCLCCAESMSRCVSRYHADKFFLSARWLSLSAFWGKPFMDCSVVVWLMLHASMVLVHHAGFDYVTAECSCVGFVPWMGSAHLP